MRILINGHDICGLITTYASEFRRRGHEVVTVAMPNRFTNYEPTYQQYGFMNSYLMKHPAGTSWIAGKVRTLLYHLFKQVKRRSPAVFRRLETKARLKVCRNIDLYIQIWANLPDEKVILESLSQSNVPILSCFLGDDIRIPQLFEMQFKIKYPASSDDISFDQRIATLRLHERLATGIFSVPDQMGAAVRPYYHLQVPLDLSKFQYRFHNRDVPVVLHIPSDPQRKGTALIEQVLNRLAAEGVKFDYRPAHDIPYDEVLNRLSDADVLVDELIFFGPGWLSFEAMASGCAVATRMLEHQPSCFQPPCWRIDSTNLEVQLRKLLTDRELRLRLSESGRAYVEHNNSVEKCCEELLEFANDAERRTPDYQPVFYRENNRLLNVQH